MKRIGCATFFLIALQAQAAGFDPVKDVAITLRGGILSVAVPSGAHLKTRTFKITLLSKGTLKLGPLPPSAGIDDAGDPIWRGTVRVALTGAHLEDPAWLEVRYQPCTEGAAGVCYLPQKRKLEVVAAELAAEPSPRP